MFHRLIIGMLAGALIVGAPTSVASAKPSVPEVATRSSAGYAAETTDPVDDREEPRAVPDDPPLVPEAPDEPSTVLDDFRVPVPDARLRTRSLTVPADNRVVGSVIAAGGSDVVPEAALSTIGTLTDRSTLRGGGADRYATAVELSSEHFPSGAADVWLATGQNFPDGLAASAIAGARGGPVLLTRPGSLPAAVQTELQRLSPQRVWVVGGPSAVSEDVLLAAEAAVPGAAVERLAGSTRYATAAALAEEFFDSTDAVFVATGRNFPDALSAGPAASGQNAPTLLVTTSSVPSSTAAQLERLRPGVVYVIGGESVVGDDVVARIRTLTGGDVERVAGANRYATAAAVADRFFDATTASLVLATGTNFPDSVAAGAVAGALASPLLLVDSRDVPPRVTVDAARRVSWWLPESGQVLRYTVVAHPDDEFAAWSVVGDRDPRRYDVFIVLTTGESTRYCNGDPVSNSWSTQQYVPQPQPTGEQYSDRCKKHRMDSWNVFADRSGVGPFGSPEDLTGGPVDWDGREVPVPLRLDEGGEVVPAGDFSVSVGDDAALVEFDLGALTSDEVLWAVQTTRALDARFPTQVEGDILGAGFFNDTGVGYENLHPDHQAVHELLLGTDLGTPGSQYATVGHHQTTRAFGASVVDYCDAMCHPGAPAEFEGNMGRFQYAYGWLASGYWRPDAVDAHAGFSAYQSFAKAF